MISDKQIREWREHEGVSMISTMGEYVPPEFWMLLSEYEKLDKQKNPPRLPGNGPSLELVIAKGKQLSAMRKARDELLVVSKHAHGHDIDVVAGSKNGGINDAAVRFSGLSGLELRYIIGAMIDYCTCRIEYMEAELESLGIKTLPDDEKVSAPEEP